MVPRFPGRTMPQRQFIFAAWRANLLQGRVELDYDGPDRKPRYKLSGTWEKPHDRLLQVTELPVGLWTNQFKTHLAAMLDPVAAAQKKKKKQGMNKEDKDDVRDMIPTIEVPLPFACLLLCFDVNPRGGLPGLIALNHTAQGYSEFHTNLTVCFVVRLTPESAGWDDHEIEKKFKLAKYVSLSNMHLYDENGRIERYDGSLDVLRQFYKIRSG